MGNDLTHLEFTLSDANFHVIKLLSSLYITIYIQGIEDADILHYN